MAKLNSYWLLKYAEHREQLKLATVGHHFSANDFSSVGILELSYPPKTLGLPRYCNTNTSMATLPLGTVVKVLSESEKKNLFHYYQIGKCI